MASLLSPSPASGSGRSSDGGGRRLSEILEEQQEPFSLDLFLLDKGCSPALLDAAGAACWLRSGAATVARALRRRRPSSGGNARASGMLRSVLSKILRGAAAAKKTAAAIDWSSPKNAGARSSPSLRCLDGTVEDDMEEAEEDEDDDDESSKQLSPVSVLEQRPFEAASPAYSKKAIVIFRELLAAAYTPALPDHPTNHSNNNSTTPNSPAPAPAPTPSTRTGRTTNPAAASKWEETLEAELAKVHGLIAAEMAAGWSAVCSFSDARRHVGAEVAAAVLDALTEEAAAELALMLTWNGRPRCDDDDIDDARCGWC